MLFAILFFGLIKNLKFLENKFCGGEEDKYDEIDEEEFQNLQKKRKMKKK